MGFLVLDREGTVGRKLCLLEGCEHGWHIDVPRAEDHALRLVLHLGEVLEMDAVEAAGEQPDHFRRLLAAPQEVPQVGAGADPIVVLLDRGEHVDRLVVAVGGTVVVDRDPDVELPHEVVEARERIGVRVCSEDADARRLREGENLPVCRGVFREPAHSIG